jgi:hypothetical protein
VDYSEDACLGGHQAVRRQCEEAGCARLSVGRSPCCTEHTLETASCAQLGCKRKTKADTAWCPAHQQVRLLAGGGSGACVLPLAVSHPPLAQVQRCLWDGCQRVVTRSSWCAVHDTPRMCAHAADDGSAGCTRPVEKGSQLCRAHGGFRTCEAGDCRQPVLARSARCLAHRRGKRCVEVSACEGGTRKRFK